MLSPGITRTVWKGRTCRNMIQWKISQDSKHKWTRRIRKSLISYFWVYVSPACDVQLYCDGSMKRASFDKDCSSAVFAQSTKKKQTNHCGVAYENGWLVHYGAYVWAEWCNPNNISYETFSVTFAGRKCIWIPLLVGLLAKLSFGLWAGNTKICYSGNCEESETTELITEIDRTD